MLCLSKFDHKAQHYTTLVNNCLRQKQGPEIAIDDLKMKYCECQQRKV